MGMHYLGEAISLTVAVSWTVTALFAEIGSKRLGSLQMNVVRMTLSLLMLGATLWWFTGVYPHRLGYLLYEVHWLRRAAQFLCRPQRGMRS